jgi:hypothetical protein
MEELVLWDSAKIAEHVKQAELHTPPPCNPQKMLSRWLLFMFLLHGIMTGTSRQLSRESCLGRLINPVGYLCLGKPISKVSLMAGDQDMLASVTPG